MSPRPGGRMGQAFLTEEEKENRPQVTRALLSRVAGFLRPYWKQMLLVLLAIAATSILNLWPALLTGQIIDEGLIGRNLPRLIQLILLSFGVLLGANLLGVGESYLNTWIAEHITFDMRNRMYKHLQMMSHGFFTGNKQGDVLTRMTGDIDGVRSVMTGTLTSILSNSITLVFAVLALFQRNPVLAVVGILVIPLFVIPTKKAGKTRWNLTREAQANTDEINEVLTETLSVSGQLLMKLFAKEDYEYSRYESRNRKIISLNIRERMAGRWFRVVITTFSSIGPMLLYLVGGILIIRYGSDLTVGDITVMVALLGKMYFPVNSLLNIQVDWIRSMALFKRIFDYYDLPVEIENSPDAITPTRRAGEIRYSDVSFAYDPARPILSDINFTLSQGQSLALVGSSGSGKSTIIHLLARLYDVDEGSIEIDGIDLRQLDLKYLRQSIGIVSQDTYLFNGSIRENLLYAKPDATEDELLDACRKANIYDFVIRQHEGLDTLVGNRGLKLSGGEKQRISIARVLLKDPAILIFDEATSALDSISERLIQDAIEPLLKSRTSIVIAHRLSTILAADEILVLENGRITERGTHPELILRDGHYKDLYDTQFPESERVPVEADF